MRKSFLILIGIVLFSTVLASSINNEKQIVLHLQAVVPRFDLGDVFSQEEIDSLDFSAVELKPRFLRLEMPIEFNGKLIFYFDWLVLTKEAGNEYSVEYDEEKSFSYSYSDFASCIGLSSKQTCINTEIEPQIKSQVIAGLTETRQIINDLKTKPPLTHIVTSNDFDFSSIGG